MKYRKLFINLVLLLAALLAQFAVATATSSPSGKQAKLTVRVENISRVEGQTASDGTKWPFALSPSTFVLHDKKSHWDNRLSDDEETIYTRNKGDNEE